MGRKLPPRSHSTPSTVSRRGTTYLCWPLLCTVRLYDHLPLGSIDRCYLFLDVLDWNSGTLSSNQCLPTIVAFDDRYLGHPRLTRSSLRCQIFSQGRRCVEPSCAR